MIIILTKLNDEFSYQKYYRRGKWRISVTPISLSHPNMSYCYLEYQYHSEKYWTMWQFDSYSHPSFLRCWLNYWLILIFIIASSAKSEGKYQPDSGLFYNITNHKPARNSYGITHELYLWYIQIYAIQRWKLFIIPFFRKRTGRKKPTFVLKHLTQAIHLAAGIFASLFLEGNPSTFNMVNLPTNKKRPKFLPKCCNHINHTGNSNRVSSEISKAILDLLLKNGWLVTIMPSAKLAGEF